MPVLGEWSFIVSQCIFGLCLPAGTIDDSEWVDSGMFRTEYNCQIAQVLYDNIINEQRKWLGKPVYYTESECFNWAEWTKENPLRIEE